VGYLLDANVFIEAKKRWYGFDFCPGFWAWLDSANKQGKVFSIERVADEILAGDDELVGWVRDGRRSMFLKPDAGVLASLTSLSRWATSGIYDASAVDTFLSAADSYIVAHAHAQGHVVVTHEQVTTNSRKNVKVPNACVEMGVKYVNTFEMLRLEKARFVLP
jgi:Domain of unknown function (DUF4411)